MPENEVVAVLDTDGHFRVFRLEDREAICRYFAELEEDCAYVSDNEEAEDTGFLWRVPNAVKAATSESWRDFVSCFSQRGSLEIVTLK